MLNVTPARDVAECHLIRLPDGVNVLIDAGMLRDAPDSVVKALRAQKVEHIDLAIISHCHLDHYGALVDVAAAGIPIDKVAVNVPDKVAADRERPWGCNLDHVHYTLDELKRRQIECFTPQIGDVLWRGSTANGSSVSLEVISLYDGLNTPIGHTDVNDTSILVRLSVGPTRALFVGDLNHPMGTYLAQSDVDLKADLLKIPHHGGEGAAPNRFFDRVDAKAALVSTPQWLWESDRSTRIRNYFQNRNIPLYPTCLRGNVTVTLTEHGYEIETER